MNIIEDNSNTNNNKSVSAKHQKIFFDYNSRQLWPEEDVEEDMDYVPEPPEPEASDDSFSAAEDHHKSGDHLVTTESNESTDESKSNNKNGLSDDRIVAPIKISKNKRKNSKNWSIVGQQSQQLIPTIDNKNNVLIVESNEIVPKKRGRRPKALVNGFNVTDATNGQKAPKSPKKPKERKNGSKRLANDYCKQKSTEDNELNNDCKVNKMDTKWQFSCLLDCLDVDFDQIIPNEILIRIFNIVLEADQNRTQSIINLSRVCESWRKLITTTPLLWQSLDLQTFSDVGFPYNDLFELLKENQLFNHLKALNLNGWSGANAERVLDSIATNCGAKLRQLSLKNCKNISSEFLQTLSTHCPNIELLDISAITFLRFFGSYVPIVRKRKRKAASHQNNQSPFAPPVFRPFLEKCGNKLLSLYLSENTMPSFHSCISSIMEFCPNLELLDVSNVESLSKTSSISIEKLQKSCPKLRVLRAANITFTSSTAGTQSVGFADLEELSIPFKSDFSTAIIQNAHTDNVLEQLTKNADKLQLLDIRGARYLSHRALVKIPTWNIRHLSISNCPKLNTEQLEMAFTKWNKSLIDVDISWNTSEESVNSCMKSLCEVGEEESQLRTLQLRGSAVSYESIKCLFKSCPKLESIDLQSCRGLPRGIKRSYSGPELCTLRAEVLEGKYD